MNTKARKAKENAAFIDYDEDFDLLTVQQTKWDLNEKLSSDRYNSKLVKRFEDGNYFDMKFLEEDKFKTPIMFENKEGLDLSLPTDDFTVDDVAINVGKDRVLDVVDVNTQDAIGMKMRDWCKYYNNTERKQLLNVISLEFSQTKLDKIIQPPEMVTHLDWLMLYWPNKDFLKCADNQSYLKTMTYPKVRKYCLMSVGGCYTDFHIDLGGTSVWYHIYKGEKIFWMIPPTEDNIKIFETWNQSIDQANCFLGDLVKDCERVCLPQGTTFMIPSGWIHGVYTPKNSLVFGGNFLHSFSVDMQLRVWQIEEKIKVGIKYRYPFFIEVHWYVLAGLISRVTGRKYLRNSVNDEGNRSPLKDYERKAIDSIVKWLKSSSLENQKGIPNDLIDPDLLISDAINIDKMKYNNKLTSIFDKFHTFTSENNCNVEKLKIKITPNKKPSKLSPENKNKRKTSPNNQKLEPQILSDQNNFRNIFDCLNTLSSSTTTTNNQKSINNTNITISLLDSPQPVKKKSKISPKKKTKSILEKPKEAEIPKIMFDQIVSRRDSNNCRKICRPDRFIEHR